MKQQSLAAVGPCVIGVSRKWEVKKGLLESSPCESYAAWLEDNPAFDLTLSRRIGLAYTCQAIVAVVDIV